jgi:bifunctional DNA primase/polymerase-like protein
MPTLCESALLYAKRGWPITPIRPRDKRPLTARGCSDATTNEDQIASWWKRWPEANVAVRCGALPTGAGIVVLDADGPAGQAELPAFELPPTLAQRTGGGGLQMFFRLPEGELGLQSVGLLAERIDTRGEGGYVLLPPSIHPSGRQYEWLEMVEMAEAPTCLLRSSVKDDAPEVVKIAMVPLRWQPMGGTPYGRSVLTRLVQEIAKAGEGRRNDCLNRAAYLAGGYVAGGELDLTLCVESLLGAAQAAGLGCREASKTITSGISKGVARPITAPA